MTPLREATTWQTAMLNQLNQLPHQRQSWARLECPLPTREEALRWLRQQSHPQKLYWSGREDEREVAGVGVAHSYLDEGANLPAVLGQIAQTLATAPAELRYFGGARFDLARSADLAWQPYRRYQFRVPLFELITTPQQTHFVCNVAPQSEIEQIIEQLNDLSFNDELLPDIVPHPLTRYDLPSEAVWGENIVQLLKMFAQGSAEKIVLARKVTVPADGLLDPSFILQKLQHVTPHSFHFCYQLDAQHAFIGASPERLYRREKGQLISEAVAGTRKRGATLEEDAQLARDLLQSDKERREQRLVVERIEQAFEKLCDQVDVVGDAPEILGLAQLQHLYNRLSGTLSADVGDGEILARLHPTPAVGGFPSDVALATIAQLEPFDRGWYAGPIGWIGRDSAEFAVAIRSARIIGNQLSAFSGAGIVAGSTAEGEWQEIENKLLNFRRALL